MNKSEIWKNYRFPIILLSGIMIGAVIGVIFGEKAKVAGLQNVESMLVEPDFDFGDMGLNVIVSAMAMHHIEDPKKQFAKFSKALKSGGMLAIADLAKEDGSFHADNNGVYHFGFSPDELKAFYIENGFLEPVILVAHTVKKADRGYDILLSFARKR